MKQPEIEKLLRDILEAIRLIEEYASSVSQEEFQARPMVQDAILRRFTIIGEASNQLGSQFRVTHPEVPWKDIIGMRHKMIHDYKGLSLQIVWDTLTLDLPEFKAQIQHLHDSL